MHDNPQFAAFLALIAVGLFLAAENYGRLKIWRRRIRWFWLWLMLLGVGVAVVGGYLAVVFRKPDPASVDEVSRAQSAKALEEVAQLAAKVEGLSKQVETVMMFLEAERAAREASEASRKQELERAQKLSIALSEIAENGKKRRTALFNLKDSTAVAEMDEWVRVTPSALRALSLPITRQKAPSR